MSLARKLLCSTLLDYNLTEYINHRGFYLMKQKLTFKLYEGQCIVMVANHRVQENIMSVLQKKEEIYSGSIYFQDKLLDEY